MTAGSSDPLFTTPEMREVFSLGARLRRMVEVEVALARAQAKAGLVEPQVAEEIAARCGATRLDPEEIFGGAVDWGTAVPPLLKALREGLSPKAAGALHLGATSQDVIDTALVLQMREGLPIIERDLLRAGRRCATLADQHRRTVMAGRTLLQQALPITFGLKAAHWLDGIGRTVRRLRRAGEEGLALQFGGASGTLAALGEEGLEVVGLLGRELGLPVPDLPWHGTRDRPQEVVGALAGAARTIAKITGDVRLLAQDELGEVRVRPGGSSTMPHKRNPVDAVVALASARLAVGSASVVLEATEHEHERGVGSWQAEWAAVPAVFEHTSAATQALVRLLDGLEADPERMRANLEGSRGAVMAESLALRLADELGGEEAHRIVRELVRRSAEEGRHLRELAVRDSRVPLSEGEVEEVLDPAGYLGSTGIFIDRALAAFLELD